MSGDRTTGDHLTIEETISQAGGFEKFESTLREFEEINLRLDS